MKFYHALLGLSFLFPFSAFAQYEGLRLKDRRLKSKSRTRT